MNSKGPFKIKREAGVTTQPDTNLWSVVWEIKLKPKKANTPSFTMELLAKQIHSMKESEK